MKFSVRIITDVSISDVNNPKYISFMERRMNNNILRSPDNLDDSINWLYSSNNMFLYFSGHGIDRKGLKISDNRYYYPDLSVLDCNQSLVMLFDCCYSPHLNIPFQYEDNGWIVNKDALYNTMAHIILICSSQNVSYGHEMYGSTLTRCFINSVQECDVLAYKSLDNKLSTNVIEEYRMSSLSNYTKPLIFTNVISSPYIPLYVYTKSDLHDIVDV
jgi:hypothetical protein